MQRPHIRFRGAELADIDDWWPHAQNDALGYALWFLSRAALEFWEELAKEPPGRVHRRNGR